MPPCISDCDNERVNEMKESKEATDKLDSSVGKLNIVMKTSDILEILDAMSKNNEKSLDKFERILNNLLEKQHTYGYTLAVLIISLTSIFVSLARLNYPPK